MSRYLFPLRCPDCGSKISEANHICPHCGTDLDAPLNKTKRLELFQFYLDRTQKDIDKGNIKNALKNIDQAIQYEPDFAEAHNLRGLLLEESGQINEAISDYQEALRLDPEHTEAKENLQLVIPQGAVQSQTGSTHTRKKPAWLIPLLAFLAGMVCLLSVGAFVTFGSSYIRLLEQRIITEKIIFEPDTSKVTDPDVALLIKTATILTQRASDAGYSGVNFSVNNKGQIVGRIPKNIDRQAFLDTLSSIGFLELVDLGMNRLPVRSVIKTDHEIGYLAQGEGDAWHTIITNEGIRNANVVKTENGGYEIAFSLTPEATSILAEHTRANIGSILAIVLDKVILSEPVITDPITDGLGVISGGFSEQSANSLAAVLESEKLPVPIILLQQINATP